MASSKRDFEQFVEWLHRPELAAPANVKRLANLALGDFDQLAQTAFQRSHRARHLVALAREGLAQTPDLPPDIPPTVEGEAWAWRRLSRVELGPFRGFRAPEVFDLRKRLILVFGPNGSGKTSFCEALEYALLGSVQEAESKRIEQDPYLANTHEGGFAAPRLTALDGAGREIGVEPSVDAYRFCFIERNRIDSFGRMGARTAAKRTELIATLFGMERFNDFVANFNESLDSHLCLSNTKQLVLTGRRNGLASDLAVVNGEAEASNGLSNEEEALARGHSAEATYASLRAWIGSPEAPGRIAELESRIDVLPPSLVGLTRQSLVDAFETADSLNAKLAAAMARLRDRSSEVSYKELYTAVVNLQAVEGDHCPACDTPLAGNQRVAADPYAKAREGLERLRELGELQEEAKSVGEQLAAASRALGTQIGTLRAFVEAHDGATGPVALRLAALDPLAEGPWWATLFGPWPDAEADAGVAALAQALEMADLAAERDAATTRALRERQQLIDERKTLSDLREAMRAQDRKRENLSSSVAAARARIAAFNAANAALEAEAAQEALDIQRDTPIKVAYDRFLSMLRAYADLLPSTLMAGLNDLAMELYNDFNRDDLDADKLAALRLPASGAHQIQIAFRGDPGRLVDALHVLSEGHIRCLGLAILLAKSKRMDAPLIVFDDAVNAIDHDHRSGIRETIFQSDHFQHAQIIVTCHSNEFIKDIQNHLTPRGREDCELYLLANHSGDHRPRVGRNTPSRVHVVNARHAREGLNDGQALAFSRQALEVLCDKSWRWVASHNLGPLTLRLADPRARPGLRDLCVALRQKLIGAEHFQHESKGPLIAGLNAVLGIPENNLVWAYLNDGTHQQADRDDFDSALVEVVVSTIEQIDALSLRRRN